MKLAPYHGVKEYVVEILKSFDKFQVVSSSTKIFTTNLNGPFAPTMSRPSEGRAGCDTVGTGYTWTNVDLSLVMFSGMLPNYPPRHFVLSSHGIYCVG